MKTRFFLAALSLLAVGCSKNENVSTPDVPVHAKAIQIGQNVQGLTRAVVAEGSNVTATVLMRDNSDSWMAFIAVKKNDIGGDGTLQGRATVSVASFKAGTTQAVALNPSLYYNHNSSSENAFLVAVAPDGNLVASGTVVAMKNVDGQQDVMYASEVNAGSETIPTNPVNLSFAHLTTQLNFQMTLTPAASDGEWKNQAVSVKSISIQNAQLPRSVDAANGNVSWTASGSSLSVPNIANVGLSATAAKAGSPVMIMGGGKVIVDVVLTVGSSDLAFSNITIQDSANKDLIAGTAKSHLITLNVTEPSSATQGEKTISATATVAEWEVGTNGSAELN